MSNNKPKYKGRDYYYSKGENNIEDYRYIRNQPLGSKPLTLSVENFVGRSYIPKKIHKIREYPGVL